MMANPPKEIWAFYAPDIAEDNDGETIVAHDTEQLHGHRYQLSADNPVKEYLEKMDDRLLVRDGSAELSHDEAKNALRDCYLIACGKPPEFEVG